MFGRYFGARYWGRRYWGDGGSSTATATGASIRRAFGGPLLLWLDLPHVAVIQSATLTQDALGAVVKTWADVLTARCSIHPLSGSQGGFRLADGTTIDHRVYFRTKDIAATIASLPDSYRIKWGSRYLEIVTPRETAQVGEMYTVDCRELTKQL